ncbi:hypothetical protein [Pseudomonas nunensis]|uniref:hypothetical protein n=1 Tax=Pseudomonas nunensis TaxID=2961896 RepID=UPI0006B4061F|nr:hypothetical protein [Pseudomonas nunensis]KOY01369.1 hypothetical protein AM274_14665 [Pseudomonas nunensis]
MIKKILAFSVLLNIGLFQGAAQAESNGPFAKPSMPRHMAMRCGPGTYWSGEKKACIGWNNLATTSSKQLLHKP